ncbi:MAG: hypothetical protein WCH85_03685 [Methanomicrobiales archaeon]
MGAGTGAYTGIAGAGTDCAEGVCPARAPQTPQNFSEGDRGLPHALQRDCAIGGETIGRTTTIGGGVAARGGEAGITGAGAGGGSGAVAGAMTLPGDAAGTTSSSWDAPQIRQNFAFGATGFPHSGQKVIVISNESLNVVH